MEENNRNTTEQTTEQTTQQTQAQGTEQANPNPNPQPEQKEEPKKGVAERVLGGVGKLLDKAVPIVIGAVVVGGCAYVKGRHDGKEATLRKAARKVEVPPVREQEHVEQATEQTTEQRRPIGFDSYGNPIG